MVKWWLILYIVCHVEGDITIDQRIGSYTDIATFEINATYQVVLFYPSIETPNPFRVKAWSQDAREGLPALVVVQQETQITSWRVPLLVETTMKDNVLKFPNTSKTMCHEQMALTVDPDDHPTEVKAQSFILSLSTSSPTSVTINIEVEEEKDFYVEMDRNYSILVSPSEPRSVFYKFGENASDIVVIDVDSDDETCLVVSVQDDKCPVFDTNRDIKYEGFYQTINLKGALTIKKADFKHGFFLVFVAKPDNFDCSQENSFLPRTKGHLQIAPTNITTSINFRIRPSITNKEFIIITVGTFIALVIVGIVLILIALLDNRFGTFSSATNEEVHVPDTPECMSDEEIQGILETDNLTVSHFARKPRRIKKRSYHYLYHVSNIALFYSIPVVQLSFIYQRIVNQTGNEDICYFNFMCAHPALGFSDFNHIFSNVGYIIFGIIFNIVVIDRHKIINIRTARGIPVHYGLYHAMGVALIIEGLLSGCYHVCPSQANYQFDTSFMYVMVVLYMTKLYQNRHPDINATAYSTFTVLGVAILIAMIGILTGSLAIWVVFALCYIILCIFVSLKIYFFNSVVAGLKRLHQNIKYNGVSREAFSPVRKVRFILLSITNLINFAMLITGLCIYSKDVTDFGTFLLGLLMANALLYSAFYIAMKLTNGERICCGAICYGLLALGSWTASGVFFINAATVWTVTPAESRQWNQGCILGGFYDKHDVWHLSSGLALYFTFMFLMCLDDDIIDKDRSEIASF